MSSTLLRAVCLLAPTGRLSFWQPDGPTGGWWLRLEMADLPSDPRGHGPTVDAALADLADALVSRELPAGKALWAILAPPPSTGRDSLAALQVALDSPDPRAWVEDLRREDMVELATRLERAERACAEGLPREKLVCPGCGHIHVDGEDDPAFATRPHHTHRCAGCGSLWDAGRWSFGASKSPG